MNFCKLENMHVYTSTAASHLFLLFTEIKKINFRDNNIFCNKNIHRICNANISGNIIFLLVQIKQYKRLRQDT